MAQYINSQNNLNINAPVALSGAANVTLGLPDYILGVDNTDAVRTITLPTASTTGVNANRGKVYIIKDQSGAAGTNNIIIQAATGTIDGAASISIISNYGEVQVYSDGIAWFTGSSSLVSTAVIWSIQATGTALLPNQGFISTNASAQSFPLPATAAVGELFELSQKGTGDVTITQIVGQTIRFGNSVSTSGTGGSVVSSTPGDAVKLVCTATNTDYQAVTGALGNWTVI